MDKKLTTNFYKKYVGKYAKRFYSPFVKENIHKIIDFKLEKHDPERGKEAFFLVYFEEENTHVWWDIEDCVIITNTLPINKDNDERVANIFHSEYNGYNPFTGETEEKLDKFL